MIKRNGDYIPTDSEVAHSASRNRRRGVPQIAPKVMADKLKVEFLRPFSVAKQHLSLAKTSYQIAYWREVSLILLPEAKAQYERNANA